MIRDGSIIVVDFIRTLEEAVATLRKCHSVRDGNEANRCKEKTKVLQRKCERLRAEYLATKHSGTENGVKEISNFDSSFQDVNDSGTK